MTHTKAGLLKIHPKLQEAKKLIREAVKECQQSINAVKPPSHELKTSYDELIASFEAHRGAKLWYPYIGSGIGNGALVELLDGSVKYDFISGIGVHVFGHSHPEIISASIDAAISDTVMQGNLQQNADSAELVDLLIKESGLDHCILTTSGAMANENAMKIALQKNAPAHRILAFDHCFAGRTWAISQITDKAKYREGIPENVFVDYIPFFDENDPEGSTGRAVSTLKKHLSRHPKQHALMYFELIQGEAGFYKGSREFFLPLMKILKEHHIAILADEVQTFGRTSKLFAFQHFDLDEYIDIVTIGKMTQVCATLWRHEYNPKPGLISQTFTGATASIHAAKAMLHLMVRDDHFGPDGKNMQLGNYFQEKLEKLDVKGPFGIGGMIAFTPFDGSFEKVNAFAHELYKNGVIAFIAGQNPTRIRFLLPTAAITKKEIDEVLKIIEETLCTSSAH
ncbi:MAG: aminotransferase class III-fold pyridoxal phosphate-dependent enzyme [Waddliaceae bacterium]